MLRTILALNLMAAAWGQSQTAPAFEVASIKPSPAFIDWSGVQTPGGGRFEASHATLKALVAYAYDVREFYVSGGPGWAGSDRFEILAKTDVNTTPAQMRVMLQSLLAERFKLAQHRETKEATVYQLVLYKGGPKLEEATTEQVNAMWRSLLKERFGMVVHHESKEFPVEELVVTKGGPKFKETTLDPNAPPPPPPAGPPQDPGLLVTRKLGPTGPVIRMVGRAQEMSGFAMALGDQLNRPVLDKTGLTGKYDFYLEYEYMASLRPGPGPAQIVPDDNASEDLAAAIQQQLGLRLASGKAKLDVVGVDKANKVPAEN